MSSETPAPEPDDRPDGCPECGTTVFDFAPNHSDGCSSHDAWLCIGCKWGTRAYPAVAK